MHKRDYSFEELLEIERCREDAMYCITKYMNNFETLYQEHIKLRPTQLRMLDEMDSDELETFILTYRQSGCTFIVVSYLIWRLFISKKYSATTHHYITNKVSHQHHEMGRISYFYDQYKDIFSNIGIEFSELEISKNGIRNIETGGTIRFHSISSAMNGIRGNASSMVVLDNIWSYNSTINDTIENLLQAVKPTGAKFVQLQTALSNTGNSLETRPNLVRLPVYIDLNFTFEQEKERINNIGVSNYTDSYLLIRK